MAVDFKELKREDCRTVARRLGLELNRQDKVRCFLHAGDKNPSLQVYADGWKCFGCGEHGDGIDLVAKYLNIPNTEAAEWMKKAFYVQEPPRNRTMERPSGSIYTQADRSKRSCIAGVTVQNVGAGSTWRAAHGRKAGEPPLIPST